MQPSALLLLLAILICPISMGIMMWRMNKNMDDRHMDMRPGKSVHDTHRSGHDELAAEERNAKKTY